MATFEAKVYELIIEPHPNADALELARIGDYRSVVLKGQFQTGDWGVYIPEAAVLPDWLVKNLGLEGRLAGNKHNRVKAIRLRDILSQGLVYPVNMDNEHPFITVGNEEGVGSMHLVQLGDDVTNVLNIKKYEPPVPVHMAGEVFNAFGNTLKFDIENVKKYPDVLVDGEEVIFTEKLHGCVSPDALIMLPNGEEVPMLQVLTDASITHVLSYDVETKQFVSKPITNRFHRPNIENKKWIKLTMENERILYITEDHPVFSNDRQSYVKVKHLNPNEDIKSPI